MEPNADALRISKLDAALRQLQTAIRLYFKEADPVAIHTLTLAAYNVLHDLSKAAGKPVMVKDRMITENVKQPYQAWFRRVLNEPENFFKHADRDPDKVLVFRPGVTEAFLLEGCMLYHELSHEQQPLLALFLLWYRLIRPQVFHLPLEWEQARADMPAGVTASRQRFFMEALPLMELWLSGGSTPSPH